MPDTEMREVSATCKECDSTETIEVDPVAYDRYQLREGLIQTLFADRSAEDREVIMNAAHGGWFICRKCWPIVFAEDG